MIGILPVEAASVKEARGIELFGSKPIALEA
jgi:hypothetical protein